MRNTLSKKELIGNRIVSAILFVLSVVYLFAAPHYFIKGIGSDPYREYFMHETEPTSAIIKVWHIVKFKPFSGSLGGWLKERAKSFSKRYVNVYFDVVSMSEDEAEEQLLRGETPDVISFACGTQPSELFREFSSKEDMRLLAVPYCASGYLLVYDPDAALETDLDELAETAGTPAEFRSGKASSCICDIRAAGDLLRACLRGKCPSFEAEPINGENDLVQYAGLYRDIDDIKLPYASGFIEYLVSESSQTSLVSIGLLPVDGNIKAEYETEWIGKLRESFDPESLPPCFESKSLH